MTKFPPVEDIFEIIQLANQCRDYLLSKNENIKPNLPALVFPNKPKNLTFASIKESGTKFYNKIKRSNFVEKLKPKKHETNIDLAVMSMSKWKDNEYTPIDTSLRIIDKISSNISIQRKNKILDKQKNQECLNMLKELKIILTEQI